MLSNMNAPLWMTVLMTVILAAFSIGLVHYLSVREQVALPQTNLVIWPVPKEGA